MLSQRNYLILFYLFELEQNVRNSGRTEYPEYPIRRQSEGRFFTFDHLNLNGMKKIVKQVLGIDVAQKELVVCLGRMFDDWTPELYGNGTFANNKKGFEAMEKWVKKLTVETIPVRYVMEATGVYHESMAYYLDGK